MFKPFSASLLAAIMLAASSMLSACTNSNETTIEGSISMHFDLGDGRTFWPGVIVHTEDAAYFLWPYKESQLEINGKKTKWFESKFVLSASKQYQVKGQIVALDTANQNDPLDTLPEKLPAEWDGAPLKILKVSVLTELGGK